MLFWWIKKERLRNEARQRVALDVPARPPTWEEEREPDTVMIVDLGDDTDVIRDALA